MPYIVVIGNPGSVWIQSDTYNYGGGWGAAGGAPLAVGMVVHQEMASKQTATVDPDVNTPDIVVVANKIDFEIKDAAVKLSIMAASAPSVTLPCVGVNNRSELANNAQNMTFKLLSTNFGPGRAGENLAGPASNKAVPVVINAQQAKGYDLHTGGIQYLVAHEIAHSLSTMQIYNAQKYQEYKTSAPTGLTEEQYRLAFASSPQFADNEARANTIAKAIAALLGKPQMTNPPHGYQTC